MYEQYEIIYSIQKKYEKILSYVYIPKSNLQMLDLTLPCNKSWLSFSLLTKSQAREQLSGRYKSIDLLNSMVTDTRF